MEWGTIPHWPPADEAVLDELYGSRLSLWPRSWTDIAAINAEAHEAFRPRVQEAKQDRSSRSGRIVGTTILLPNTVDRLMAAVSKLLDEPVNIPRLAALLSPADADQRIRLSQALYRARKGRPMNTETVRNIALDLGIAIEEMAARDSVALNLGRAKGGSQARDGFEEIYGMQLEDLFNRLRRFPVTMRVVRTEEDQEHLLADLGDDAVQVELDKPVQRRAARSSKRNGPIFDELQRVTAWPDRLWLTEDDIRGLLSAAAEAQRVLRVGRLIRVRRFAARDPLAPSTHYRSLRIDVAFASAAGDTSVDLTQDYSHRPTPRELVLAGLERPVAGDLQAEIEAVRADIRWCGHWEGRWLPCWPVPRSEELRARLCVK